MDSPSPAASGDQHDEAGALCDLPRDELLRYAQELGLKTPDDTPHRELVDRIRAHQALLIELDREALFDIVVWARQPVRKSAGKEELARQIAQIQRTNYEILPPRGLAALARLRGIGVRGSDRPEDLAALLRRQDGFWKRLGLHRRKIAGSLISWIVERAQAPEPDSDQYRFLPEDPSAKDGAAPRESLRKQIEDHGVVGGLATRIRGAADEYVRQKLDEIEVRIDGKLDEIDKRLSEWRDREVANRLRILKITLFFSVLVAILSLGYNYLKSKAVPDGELGKTPPAARTTEVDP